MVKVWSWRKWLKLSVTLKLTEAPRRTVQGHLTSRPTSRNSRASVYRSSSKSDPPEWREGHTFW